MVELVELGQVLGVVLVALELAHDVEQAAEQVLVAAAEVDVRLGDVAAQRGLLHGEADGRVLHVVERPGHVGDLVAGPDPDGVGLGVHQVLAGRGVEDVLHRDRQPVGGHGWALALVAQGRVMERLTSPR